MLAEFAVARKFDSSKDLRSSAGDGASLPIAGLTVSKLSPYLLASSLMEVASS